MRRPADLRGVLLIAGLLALLAAGTTAVIVLSDWKKRAKITAGDQYDYYMSLLNAAEDKYGIPRDLLARQAYEESRFRPDIVSGQTASPAGALGIMQIVPRFHPNADPLNVPAAIDYAAAFMKQLHDEFGLWSLALAAYNAGPGNVQKAGNNVPAFAETQNYVADILSDTPGVGMYG